MMNLKFINRSFHYNLAFSYVFLFLIFISYCPILFNISEITLHPIRSQFKIICHQELDRFFHVDLHFPLICARCSGIYLAAVFVPFFSVKPIKNFTLFLVMILSLTDKYLEWFFKLSVSNELRFFAGIVFGGALFYFLIYKLKK